MDVSESFITVPLPMAEPPDSPPPKQVTDINRPDQGHKKKPVTTSSRKTSKKASKKQEKKKSDATLKFKKPTSRDLPEKTKKTNKSKQLLQFGCMACHVQ